MSNRLMDFNPQMETFEYEFESGAAQSESEVFNEAEQMELAAELLEVRDEAELEQFLGSLIKKAGSALGKIVKSPVGQAIGGFLKSAAKKALPSTPKINSAIPSVMVRRAPAVFRPREAATARRACRPPQRRSSWQTLSGPAGGQSEVDTPARRPSRRW